MKFLLARSVVILSIFFCVTAQAVDREVALAHARKLLKANPLIDGHNDLPWLIREEANGDLEAFGLDRENGVDTDIPKLRKGLVGAQFWSVWIPGESKPQDAARIQMEQIDTARRMIAAYPGNFATSGWHMTLTLVRYGPRLGSWQNTSNTYVM